MENPYSIVPYNDPTDDDNPSTERILMFGDEGPSLGFDQLPEFPEPSSCRVGVNEGDHSVLLDPNDPMSDSFIWDLLNNSNGNEDGHFVAVPDENHGERTDHGNCGIPQSIDFENPIQLSVWPLPPSPYTCSSCHILREIIHTNGIRISNLEIHGRLGMISHAILDIYDFDFSTQNHLYQMYDFSKESIISVKNFLLQYCESRKWEGYTMVQDPLSIFYEALCVGIDENNAFFQPAPMASGNDTMPRQEDIASQKNAQNDGLRHSMDDCQENGRPLGENRREFAKSSLAAQRERTGKMKLKDFSGYFHLPINEAAKQMRVCPTVIKKKCREAGLSRWPYRKIKGIKRKIVVKEQSLSSATAEERAHALAEIQMLEQELANTFEQLRSHDPRGC